MKIFVTGGTGYIGSHTCVELLQAGNDVVILDNLYNSQVDVVEKIQEITKKSVTFYEGDCCDKEVLEKIFKEQEIEVVIHFAGYKAVGESIEKPLKYYENNIMSTLVLCKVMAKYNCKRMIFSSSATVYGNPKEVPVKEEFPLGPATNPYGTTKLMIEHILSDIWKADGEWSIILLRYFNPIGAHESGLIGDSLNSKGSNLMPYIVKVAQKEVPILTVYGSGKEESIRDYIHVVDVGKGHVKAIEKVRRESGMHVYNLGTGKGYRVLDVVKTFQRINQVEVPYEIAPKRCGEVGKCYASIEKVEKELGWKAEKGLEEMCRDAWKYVRNDKKRYTEL